MKNKEAVEQLEELMETCKDFKKFDNDIWDKDIKALKKAIKSIKEIEKYKIALFGAIRNNTVLPVGLAKNKSFKEINKMSVETMKELVNGDTIDWERMTESYLDGGGKL